MSITLPIASVQPTFSAVIDDVHSGIIPSEEFWLSVRKLGSPTIHAKVNAVLDERNRDQVNLTSSDLNVKIFPSGDRRFSVDAPSFGIVSTKLFTPSEEYADPERSDQRLPHRITAFDISADGSQFATGFLDGSVHLYQAANPSSFHKHQQLSRAHKSTVTSIQFFPSSRVLLTAGADFTLNILPANPEDAPANTTSKLIQPVRSIRGHTRSITSTAIISRGRNILSSSSDGTLRLWDVGTGSQIKTMSGGRGQFTSITGIALGDRGESELGRIRPDGEEEVLTTTNTIDPREVDTSDKLVFCSLQSGHFEAFDLQSKQSVFLSPAGTALTTISYSPAFSLIATGSSSGVVTLYDTRSLSSPLTSFSRNTSSIEDLVFVSPEASSPSVEATILISTSDAFPYLATVRPEGPDVIGEIVGGDCDPVRVMRTRGSKEFWTASDDGIVRKYIAW